MKKQLTAQFTAADTLRKPLAALFIGCMDLQESSSISVKCLKLLSINDMHA
jgi:hypothetical protein